MEEVKEEKKEKVKNTKAKKEEKKHKLSVDSTVLLTIFFVCIAMVVIGLILNLF